MPVIWFDGLAVNIERIDSQHRGFIGLLNSLEHSIQSKQGYQYMDELTDKLSEYARMHFSTEEALMRRYDFPDTEKHIAEHKAFVERIVSLSFDFDLKENEPGEILKYLENWLITHINDTDKKLGVYLADRGVS